jgi:BirA family transcriptional regulator, biotin operon repressor / biotin---[acetyl-CoA-carboxylase] ligase
MQLNPFITILDSVDSTNNYAMAQVREGMASHGMAIAAKIQTAGKGQRGRKWQTVRDENIALSLILSIADLKPPTQFCLSMAVSLGVNDFFSKYAGNETKIKWPNDLYWRDRKAGGILIESVFKGKQWEWAVVGIGININQAVFDQSLVNPVSLYQITGNKYDITLLLEDLYHFVIKRVQQLSAEQTGNLLTEYNEHLYKRNELVKLKKNAAVFNTNIKGVALNGELCTTDTMERQFNFGEIEWIL